MAKPLSFLFIGIGVAVAVIVGYSLYYNSTFMNNSAEGTRELPLRVGGENVMKVGDGNPVSDSTLPVHVAMTMNLDKPASFIRLWEIFADWTEQGGSKGITVTDTSGKDVWNNSEFIVNNSAELAIKDVTCADQVRTAKFGSATIVPLSEKMQGELLASYDLPDISSENDKYHLKFASFYETEIMLPDNAVIESDNSATCDIQGENFEKIYLYDVVFRLD